MVLSQAMSIMGLLVIDLFDAFILVGYLAIAWMVGTVTLITPAGLGIREVVFVLLIQQSHPGFDTATLALLALGLRLWQISHELLGAALVALVAQIRAKYRVGQ